MVCPNTVQGDWWSFHHIAGQSEGNKAIDDHTNLCVIGAESHLCVSDRGQSDSLRGLPLTRLSRSGDWADSFDAEEHAEANVFLEPLLEAVPAAA